MNFQFISTLILVFFTFSLVAQNPKPEEIRATFWGNKAEAYQNASLPEKWEGESAVILYQKIGYDYSKVPVLSKLNATSYYHSRVVLLDKAAVKEFSEFSFSETYSGGVGYQRLKGKSNVGFKIIKPDGTEKEVDLDKAVEVDEENRRDNRKKIAIPDLQVGDVLDYYYQMDERFNIVQMHAFDPVLTTLNQDYPLAHQEVEFNVGDNFYIYFQSLNGAPELKNESKDGRRIYRLVTNDIDKNENKNWYYPYRSAPTLKFQVVYSKTPYFISYKTPQDDTKPKNRLTKEEILAIYDYSTTTSLQYKGLKKHLKNKGLLGQNNEAMIKEAYRYLYHQLIGKKIEKLYLGQANISNNVGRTLLQDLAYFCSREGIKRDWLITVPREYSDLDDVLLFGELTTLLGINLESENKSIYFSSPGLYPHYNEIPGEYEGAMAYVASSKEKIKLPVSSSKANHTSSTTHVRFKKDDMTTLEVEKQYTHKGRNRYWYQGQLLGPYDYLEKEMGYFGEALAAPVRNSGRGIKITQEQLDNLKEELAKQHEESLKYVIEDNYKCEISNIHDFEVQSPGRFFEDSTAYSYHFDAKGMVSKAGPNYIVQAGNFIGSQVEIPEKGMQRTADVYMPYARSFSERVVIELPEGYKVQGLQNLNKKVANEAGGFSSEASVEGNQLIIKTTKWYINNFEPAENWDKMLEFLEAAYQFTQEKVLLKKGG